MYAVIRSGGKQYRVREGDTIRVEKLPAGRGEKVTLDEVLLVSDGDNVTVGNPHVKDARVTATVQAQGRGPKVKIVKFKRRKGYLRQKGHRQSYTELAITGIKAK